MAINSKVDLCNMSLGVLGNYGTVTDIDTPSNDKETTFSVWYDISRQVFLKMTIPNFSLARRVIAKAVITAPFGSALGYQNAYEYPNDCLKVLGIGEVKSKENNYAVEGGYIWTNEDYPTGLPLRFVLDVTDVTAMSPEWKLSFSYFLALQVVMDITQDVDKANSLLQMIPDKMASVSGVNAQENMPIRISRSRFMEARYNGFVSEPDKR